MRCSLVQSTPPSSLLTRGSSASAASTKMASQCTPAVKLAVRPRAIHYEEDVAHMEDTLRGVKPLTVAERADVIHRAATVVAHDHTVALKSLEASFYGLEEPCQPTPMPLPLPADCNDVLFTRIVDSLASSVRPLDVKRPRIGSDHIVMLGALFVYNALTRAPLVVSDPESAPGHKMCARCGESGIFLLTHVASDTIQCNAMQKLPIRPYETHQMPDGRLEGSGICACCVVALLDEMAAHKSHTHLRSWHHLQRRVADTITEGVGVPLCCVQGEHLNGTMEFCLASMRCVLQTEDERNFAITGRRRVVIFDAMLRAEHDSLIGLRPMPSTGMYESNEMMQILGCEIMQRSALHHQSRYPEIARRLKSDRSPVPELLREPYNIYESIAVKNADAAPKEPSNDEESVSSDPTSNDDSDDGDGDPTCAPGAQTFSSPEEAREFLTRNRTAFESHLNALRTLSTHVADTTIVDVGSLAEVLDSGCPRCGGLGHKSGKTCPCFYDGRIKFTHSPVKHLLEKTRDTMKHQGETYHALFNGLSTLPEILTQASKRMDKRKETQSGPLHPYTPSASREQRWRNTPKRNQSKSKRNFPVMALPTHNFKRIYKVCHDRALAKNCEPEEAFNDIVASEFFGDASAMHSVATSGRDVLSHTQQIEAYATHLSSCSACAKRPYSALQHTLGHDPSPPPPSKKLRVDGPVDPPSLSSKTILDLQF